MFISESILLTLYSQILTERIWSLSPKNLSKRDSISIVRCKLWVWSPKTKNRNLGIHPSCCLTLKLQKCCIGRSFFQRSVWFVLSVSIIWVTAQRWKPIPDFFLHSLICTKTRLRSWKLPVLFYKSHLYCCYTSVEHGISQLLIKDHSLSKWLMSHC